MLVNTNYNNVFKYIRKYFQLLFPIMYELLRPTYRNVLPSHEEAYLKNEHSITVVFKLAVLKKNY